jgi:SPP1 family predicted phage head-tail adaptor
VDIISGKFDNQITLFSPVATQSTSSGATSYTYTEVSTIWCYVNTRANTEQFIEGKRNVDDKLTIDVRFNDVTNVTNEWQFQYEGLEYSIVTFYEAPEYGRRNAVRIVGEILK